MFEWTQEIEARALALWNAGLPAAAIGREIGVTKNALLGKAHRRGFPPRLSPIGVRVDGSVTRVRRVPTAGVAVTRGGGRVGATLAALGLAEAVPVEVALAPRPVAPVLSRRPCCWPMWGNNERPTHVYCEAPGVLGKSYCAAHGARAWVRLEPRSPAQLAADDSRRAIQMARGERRAAQGLPWAAA